jgi:hypothetical protein
MMAPVAIPNDTDTSSKRDSISSSQRDIPVSSFDTLKRTSYSSTSNRRSSFVESLDEIPDKRLSRASASSNPPVNNSNNSDRRALTSKNEVPSAPAYSNNGNRAINNVPLTGGNTLNEIEEAETVTYLDTMKNDLKNSKIHNYKVLRKFAKVKSFFTQPFNANKSIKREA